MGATNLTTVLVDDPVLTYLRVDHQVRLQFGGTEVVIESPFTLRVGGVRHGLDPEHRAGLGPLLGLYPDTLCASGVNGDGTLRLEFAGGAVLTVPPDPSYEAWQVTGPGTALIVCQPGGGLAVWS